MTTTAPLAADDIAGDDQSMLDKGKEVQQFSGPCASCAWFKASPLKRMQFAIMLLFAILCVVWIIIRATGTLTGDIIAGLMALVLAVHGARHFRTLLGLKEQVDQYAGLNNQFSRENAELEAEVNKLRRAQEQLQSTQMELQSTTAGFQDNVAKFKTLDENLQKLGGSNIAGLDKLREMSQHVQDTLQKQLLQHERDILFKVQEAMELKDDQDGLTESEFDQFVQALPQEFQHRFEAIHFHEKAGDDGVMDLQEFKQMTDEFALLEAKRKGYDG